MLASPSLLLRHSTSHLGLNAFATSQSSQLGAQYNIPSRLWFAGLTRGCSVRCMVVSSAVECSLYPTLLGHRACARRGNTVVVVKTVRGDPAYHVVCGADCRRSWSAARRVQCSSRWQGQRGPRCIVQCKTEAYLIHRIPRRWADQSRGPASNRPICPLQLLLGGKGAAVVFDDVDVDAAYTQLAAAITLNTGQVCCTATRWLIHDKIYGRFVNKVTEVLKQIRMGPGLTRDTQMGPLVSQTQRGRVLGVFGARHEGGRMQDPS